VSHGHVPSRKGQTEILSIQKEDLRSSSEVSDCGYATQMENRESISASSNEDQGLHSKRC
jgi:hypothetical protein